MRRHRLALALLALLAGSAVAQDFPVDPPRRATSVGQTPPPLLALPAGEPPAAELITPFQLLDHFVLPGTRQRLQWRPPDGLARGEIPSPIIVAHGALPGPVLCLVAGIHGDELNGIEVVRRIAEEVDPTRLEGTLVAAPIVNVFGFSRGSRYLPDRRDLNRHFPGSRSGSIASRMAHGFFNDIVRRCDAVVDFHTGSFQRANLPQVRADLSNPDVLEFTRGFGGALVLHSQGSRGMLRLAAVAAGIPAVTFEVGGPQFLEEEHIAAAAETIRALMHAMGLLPQEERNGKATPPQAIYQGSRWVRTNAGGFFFAEVKLGERVRPGQRLGWVVDPLTNTRTEILSPFDGRVIGKALDQQVLPGYAAFHIGRHTSEQQAALEAAEGAGTAESDEEEDPADRPAADADPERE